MPLNEQLMAKALSGAYDQFKIKLNDDYNNGGGGGSNGGGSGGNGGGGGNNNGGDNNGNDNGNNKPDEKPINPTCPVHGPKPLEILCPYCGHTRCGCKFHHPDPPVIKVPANPITGNEINADNWEDLKKQAENDPGTGNDKTELCLDLLSKAVDANLQMATPSMPNCSIVIAAGTLKWKTRSNPILYAVEIAVKIMAYWTICVAPTGTPVAGPILSQVTLNAPTLALPMAIEILQMTLKSKAGDDYLPLAEIICKYSRQVVFTVVEQVGTSPVSYPVTLS